MHVHGSNRMTTRRCLLHFRLDPPRYGPQRRTAQQVGCRLHLIERILSETQKSCQLLLRLNCMRLTKIRYAKRS